MKNYLQKKKRNVSRTGTVLFLLSTLFVFKADAQVTFQSLLKFSPKDGKELTVQSTVLAKDGSSGGVDAFLPKPGGNAFPSYVAADQDGNVAFAYNKTHLYVASRTTDRLLCFNNVSPGATITSMAMDNDDEFLYVGTVNAGIRRFVWKNNGNATSVKNHMSKAIGASTAGLAYISLINTNDLVFLNGGSTRTTLFPGGMTIKGLVFDTDGDLYYADATSASVKKIAISKITGTGTVGTNTITVPAALSSEVKVGNLVSGLGIPEGSYIGSIALNEISLVTIDGVAPSNLTAAVDNTSNIVVVTGVDDIIGTGVAGTTAVPAIAKNVQVKFQTDVNFSPIGMAFDASKNLYLTDQQNSRILKIENPGTKISKESNVTAFLTNTSNNISGMVIKDNNLYYSDRGFNRVNKVPLAGGAPATIAGSDSRLIFRGSITDGATTVELTAAGGHRSKLQDLKVGMFLRADNDIYPAVKVASIDLANFKFELEIPARATKTSIDANTGANFVASSEDGFTTVGTGTNTGRVDGPSGLALINNGSGFDIVVAEGNGYSIRILSGVGTLPISLTSFKAVNSNLGSVNLNWSTSSEIDNGYFLLRRSTDGVNYVIIDSQKSKGSNGAMYSYTDANAQSGINYYSLSQVDKDGVAKEVGIKSVNITPLDGNKVVSVYPNPITNSEFTVSAPDIKTPVLNLSIKNLQGKEVFGQTLSKTEDGFYHIKIGANLSAGVYVLTLNNSKAQKLIIQ